VLLKEDLLLFIGIHSEYVGFEDAIYVILQFLSNIVFPLMEVHVSHAKAQEFYSFPRTLNDIIKGIIKIPYDEDCSCRPRIVRIIPFASFNAIRI
jgi:hypothetical protein